MISILVNLTVTLINLYLYSLVHVPLILFLAGVTFGFVLATIANKICEY